MYKPTLDPSADNYDQIWARQDSCTVPSSDLTAHCHVSSKPIWDVSIVDVGAGNGRYSLYFNKIGYKHVTSIEQSKVGCDVIRKKATNRENMSVIQADILKYESDCQYDVVVSSGLLEEFTKRADQKRAVSDLQKMTAPGGKLVMRYCLFISSNDPAERVDENLVPTLFSKNKNWQVELLETDKDCMSYNAPGGAKHSIRRQTVVARHLH